jgi:hypothetical protein
VGVKNKLAPRQNSKRIENGLSATVDNFVDVKASNFNKVRQTSTRGPQTFQYQSLKINKNP